MSMIANPMMDMMMASQSLGASTQKPQSAVTAPGLAQLYRSQMLNQSMRRAPQGHGTPMHAHFENARQTWTPGGNGDVQVAQPSVWQAGYVPGGPSAATPDNGTPASVALKTEMQEEAMTHPSRAAGNARSAQPSMVPMPQQPVAGRQADGSWNTEVLHSGGQNEMVQFNQAGDATGTLQASHGTYEQPAPPKAGKAAAAPKAPDFNKDTEQARFMYNDLQRQAQHVQSQIDRGLMDPQQTAQAHQQLDALHKQMDTHAQTISKWNPDEAAASQREKAGGQEVNEFMAQNPGHFADEEPEIQAGKMNEVLGKPGVANGNVPKGRLSTANPGHTKIAQQFLMQAGGNKDKARQLAQAAGYKF